VCDYPAIDAVRIAAELDENYIRKCDLSKRSAPIYLSTDTVYGKLWSCITIRYMVTIHRLAYPLKRMRDRAVRSR